MKPILHILSAIALVATLNSCNNIYKFELENIVRAECEKCPMPINEGMMQTKVELTDTCVLFTIEYDENLYQANYVDGKASSIKQTMLNNINVSSIDMRSYLNELASNAKNCRLPLIWLYKSSRTHKETIVKIEPEEIAN